MNKLVVVSIVLTAACGGAGMGDAVRKDITERMQTAQSPIGDCYKKTLEGNRKAKGVMVLEFAAAPKTGELTDIKVLRDDVGDPDLKACVVAEVGKLKLAKPQDTRVAVPEYPINFAPVK